MAKIEWAMWANEQVIASTFILIIGGVLSVISSFNRWQIGAYSLALAAVVFIIEYPRSKRIKGNTQQRRLQYLVTPIVNALGLFGRNYYMRFVFYLLGSIPCFFLLPTTIGAFTLLIGSVIYLEAAIKGEKWRPCDKPIATGKSRMSLKKSHAPTEAPPRLRPQNTDISNRESDEEDEHFYDNITNKF